MLERMRAAGVGMALNISTSMRDLDAVVAFAQREEGIFASVGIHPDSTDGVIDGVPQGEELDVETLVAHARRDKVVAIGETGLDYYRLREPLDWQRERFRTHIRAARECRKPLVIHTRAAAEDTLRIMREEGAREVGGVMHCFTESAAIARAAMDLGFRISFSGILTFKSARDLREVALLVPDDYLLVETDAPYLAPMPNRGRTNEPAWVRYVAVFLAQLRKQEIDHIEYTTTSNFYKLFNILK